MVSLELLGDNLPALLTLVGPIVAVVVKLRVDDFVIGEHLRALAVLALEEDVTVVENVCPPERGIPIIAHYIDKHSQLVRLSLLLIGRPPIHNLSLNFSLQLTTTTDVLLPS
jgi:hypothetical protein